MKALPIKKEAAEAASFIDWMTDNHFTFLGCEDFTVEEKAGKNTYC